MATFGIRASAVKAACRSPAREEISAKVLSCISLMSAPAAKTLGPPQSTTAPTRWSSPNTLAASRSSSWTCSLRAFTGGRSSRMVPTLVASSTSTRTNSPTILPPRPCDATRSRRPDCTGSESWWFGVVAPDLPERIDHLAFGGRGSGGVDQQGDQVLGAGGRAAQALQRPVDPRLIAGGAAAGQFGALAALHLLGDPQDLQLLLLVAGGVLVDPDDDLGALFQLLLVGERRIGHLLLEPAPLDPGQHALQHRPVP